MMEAQESAKFSQQISDSLEDQVAVRATLADAS